MKKLKLAVLLSGFGSNLQAIINEIKKGKLNAEIVLVVSNKAEAYGLKRAKKENIPTQVFGLKEFREKRGFGDSENEKLLARRAYCQELAKLVTKTTADLVVMAGWMLVLTDEFLKKFPNRVINLHPALIPAFPGTEAIKQAFDFGVKVTGVSVHFVPDEGVDTGPVILQEAVRVKETDTLESLEQKIHKIEHCLLPQAIKLFGEGKLKLKGRKVKIIS
ncbi:phosphoribosylglycinamide formyltransferase [Candidatus Berkelbacteria bacterium]|nr:phosphoribosylglycinamide formyltransferase [Candidatus Berkelbacteria bacterium]